MDKLQILLENLSIHCRYYKDDRCCGRVGDKYKFTNCSGDINECDLKQEELDGSEPA